VSDLKAKLLNSGDRELVELAGIGQVEVRTCRVGERMEVLRLTAAAAALEDPVVKMLAAVRAQNYLLAVTVRDPESGALVFDPANPDEVGSGMESDAFEALGLVAMRVCGLDKLLQKAAEKNESRVNGKSSTVSPEISTAPSKNSEDGSPALSTASV
jgi:hypothetical protein